jgi:Sodium/calcium exchanger protein
VVLAVLLVGGYAFYVHVTIKSGGADLEETPDNLTLWPSSSPPPTWAVAAQVLGMVAVMGVGAHFFVHGVEHLSKSAGIPAGLIALVLAPLATELPEKFNSVIWLRGDKDTLALGNIIWGDGLPELGAGRSWPHVHDLGTGLSQRPLGRAGARRGRDLLWLLRTKRPLESEYLLVGGVCTPCSWRRRSSASSSFVGPKGAGVPSFGKMRVG